MGSPIATNDSSFICQAFPDVCKTQVGPAQVPIPYPNIGKLSDATGFAPTVFAGGFNVISTASQIPDQLTTGDEAGAIGGVRSGTTKGAVKFKNELSKVFVNGQAVVRMFDKTEQNNGNALGQVLSGMPTVLVGP
ncbi:DUF4150 domain-containing protein [bacterium]|nr:DUF4150 domain-containing protein [bacterium]